MVRLQRVLLCAMAVFWAGMGALAVTDVLDFGLSSGAVVLGVLMLGNGIVLLLAALFSAKGHRVIDILTLLVLGANVVLSVTDELGALDVASLLLSLAIMALVLGNMRRVSAERGGER